LLALARRAEQHGIQPVPGTITPSDGSTFESFRAAGNDEIRQTVNHAVTTQRDRSVVDFAAGVAEPGDEGRGRLRRPLWQPL
jgi:hypothetical protein